jgi:two-component system response regulator YesN
MYTVLIVDDEPLSQVGLKSMIDWAELEVEIVGTASNGLSALEDIRRLRPDIVIADLRMPMLDGLGLVERCRAEPDGCPVFVVVTGYADFDSLRRAMRDSVVDYLVKLELDESSLRAGVEKAKAAVRERRRIGLSPQSGAIADPFAETVLTRLLTGSFSDDDEAAAALMRSGVSLRGAGFRVALFDVEYAGEGRLSEEERLRAYRCAVDMVKQIVGREMLVMVVPFDTTSFAAVLCAGSSDAEGISAPGSSDGKCVETLEGARDVVEKYFGLRLRAGVGLERRRAIEAAESYREARAALAVASNVSPIVVFERGGASPRSSSRLLREEVIRALRSRSAAAFRSVLNEALAELDRPDISLTESLALCCEFFYPVLEHLDGARSVVDSVFSDESENRRSPFSARNPRAASAWLKLFGEGVCAYIESVEIRGRNPLVAGVKRYVRENYASHLSLAEISSRFDVSPNHLSTVFKKYAGIGFAEYVAEVKIEKAKELIASGRYKMFQVAQLVGFEDAFYFSKVFKRVTGMSPREFYLSRCERGPSMSAEDGEGCEE